MKKSISLFLMLFLLIAAHAQTSDFTISIMGTSYNTYPGSVEVGGGSMKWYRSGSTIVVEMNNVNLESNSYNIRPLTIAANLLSVELNLKGTNTLKSQSNSCVDLQKIMYFYIKSTPEDNGSLSMIEQGGGYNALNAQNVSRIYIQDCDVYAEGSYAGIGGQSSTLKTSLQIERSNVTSKCNTSGEGHGAFAFLKGFYLTACDLVKPTGADFKVGLAGIALNGELCEEVVYKPTTYGLTIGGVQVDSKNRSNIPIQSGKASYDNLNKILTLDNANITTLSGYAINNKVDGLSVKLVGNNTIDSYYGILSTCGFSISGESTDDRLDHTGQGYFIVSSGDLSISNCTLQSNKNIKGGTDYELTISDAEVSVNNCSWWKQVNMNGVQLLSPEGAEFNSSRGGYLKDGSLVQGVKIGKNTDYALTVMGQEVNRLNASDITGDGSMSYDPTTNTLTLYNATVEYDDEAIIESDIDGLIIDIQGYNSLQSTSPCISSTKDYTIKGNSIDSHLACSGSWQSIRAEKNLDIENCNIEAGVIYNTTSSGRCRITSSNITTRDISGFNSVSFSFCYVESPAGAEYVNGQYNTDYSQSLVIKVMPAKINGNINVTQANCADVLGDGTVCYDYDTHTLTLHNASLTSIETAPNLTIYLIGKNKIVGNDPSQSSAIYFSKGDLTIKGTGRLDISNVAQGITNWDSDGTLKIKNCKIDITTSQYGLLVYKGKIDLENANVHLQKPDADNLYSQPLFYCSSYDINNCHLTDIEYADFLSKYNNWASGWKEMTIVGSLKLGDANGDDKVSASDLTTLINYLKDSANGKESSISSNADANQDNITDKKDIDIILEILLNE